jgi:hypothetical protein
VTVSRVAAPQGEGFSRVSRLVVRFELEDGAVEDVLAYLEVEMACHIRIPSLNN